MRKGRLCMISADLRVRILSLVHKRISCSPCASQSSRSVLYRVARSSIFPHLPYLQSCDPSLRRRKRSPNSSTQARSGSAHTPLLSKKSERWTADTRYTPLAALQVARPGLSKRFRRCTPQQQRVSRLLVTGWPSPPVFSLSCLPV